MAGAVAEVTLPRPLAENDDRNAFDCGRESMNGWFRRHAWANHASGASRVNVICEASSARIVGYVTLSAAQIERAFLPKAQQRNRPDPLPATLLGQLAGIGIVPQPVNGAEDLLKSLHFIGAEQAGIAVDQRIAGMQHIVGRRQLVLLGQVRRQTP